MIIIPSRGRPHLVKRFIEAYRATDAICPVILRVDKDDPDFEKYFELATGPLMPGTWRFAAGPRAKCPQAFAWLFEAFPNEPWYALFGDDVVPETVVWDRLLIEAAGTKKVSYGHDKYTYPRCPHPIIGGDLVRAVGWLAFPGVLHWYMDTAWEWLAGQTGRLIAMPEVVTAHYHADADGSHDQTHKDRWLDLKTGVNHGQGFDEAVWKQWHDSGEAAKVVERINRLCPL